MLLRERSPLLGFFWLLCGVLTGCSAELERYETERSPRGTFGEEVYKALCRRIAGNEYPSDITGRRSQAICMGDADTVRREVASGAHAPRLAALARRRATLASTFDTIFPADVSDPFEQLLRTLVPFYELPEERVQSATRALATLLERLAGKAAVARGGARGARDDEDAGVDSQSKDAEAPADRAALGALARLGAQGMAPVDLSLGLPRALVGASGLREMAAAVLPLTHADPAVAPAFEALLGSLALELASSHDDPDAAADIADLKAFLLRTAPEFGAGKPLYTSLRDARGLPIPAPVATQAVPFPFVDADGDGAADAEDNRLRAHPGATASLPLPFPAVSEPATARDAFGRALTSPGEGEADRLLYRHVDLDDSLLAGALRVGHGLFASDQLTRGLAGALVPLVGDPQPATMRYGALDLTYAAGDASVSPLRDLVHALGALRDQPVFDEALAFSKRLLREQELPLVEALTPLLTLERRTRPDADAYPAAKLKPGHALWDQLLRELELLSRRRIPSEGAGGATLLEALTRASLGFARDFSAPGAPIAQVHDPDLLRRQGSVYATLMRFKDEWRGNPKGESERAAGEPLMIGAFRTPVDRSQPDSPVTCGRDGCGGLIEGTPFARWRSEGQNCVLQRPGRPITGKDCGAPANQSIFQRSLGLIAEMAGRSQCNKPITIDELLESASDNPCVGAIKPGSAECQLLRQAQLVERQATVREAENTLQNYACPADAPAAAPCRAFVDRYPAAFIDPDGPGRGVPASIPACHMLDLPDVGRTFGAVLLSEYTLEFPNPWVRRYLEDIARAGDHDGDGAQDLPSCTAPGSFANFPILDPALAPACVPEAAKLARDLYKTMPGSVDTLGELVAFMLDDSRLFASDADLRALKPDAKALSRVMFAVASGEGFTMFDPPLVRGAPRACAELPGVPACAADDTAPTPAGGCCIEDLAAPPLRFRLDTYYGATTFAWEQPLQLVDGRTLSFLDTMKALTDAVARYDYDARRGDDPRAFEDLSYPFSSLGKLLAEHYDTAANPLAQDRDPAAPHYRRLTGIGSYEELLADAFDDGSIARDQAAPDGTPLFAAGAGAPGPEQQLGLMFHAQPLLAALLGMQVGAGDGIDFASELAEQLLNPHARCAGAGGDRRVIAGEGACDRARRGEPGLAPPLTTRTGSLHVCQRDGRCHDGSQLPLRFAAPAHQLVGALLAVDDRQQRDPTRERALRSLIAGLCEGLLTTRDGRFADRRALTLLTTLLDHAGEQVSEERAAGTLATSRARADADLDALLREPVVAGLIGFLDALRDKPEALAGISRYAASLLTESETENNLRPLVAGLFDALQLLPASPDTRALMHALASAFASNVEALVRDGGAASALAPANSASGRSLFMLGVTAKNDRAEVLPRVLHNLTSAPAPGQHAPIEVLLDLVLDINRVEPGAQRAPDLADLQLNLRRISEVMRDDKRGFERMYELMRCTTRPGSAGCD